MHIQMPRSFRRRSLHRAVGVFAQNSPVMMVGTIVAGRLYRRRSRSIRCGGDGDEGSRVDGRGGRERIGDVGGRDRNADRRCAAGISARAGGAVAAGGAALEDT